MSKTNCHTGNPIVFVADGITVHAGGNMRNGGWHVMKPMPDVAIGPEGVLRTKIHRDRVPNGWSCASAFTKTKVPHFVVIEWPDFSIPSNAGAEFWHALVNDFKVNNIKTVSASCAGGHGRTGVQLCILAHIMLPTSQHSWKDVAELITYIRSVYCEHAVEGKSQQQYIADVLALPVGEDLFKMSKDFGYIPSTIDYQNMYEELEDDSSRMKPKKSKPKKNAKYPKKSKTLLDDWNNDDEWVFKGSFVEDMVLLECMDCEDTQWHKSGVSIDTECNVCYNGVLTDVYDKQIDYETNMICNECNLSFHTKEMMENTATCKLCFHNMFTDKKIKPFTIMQEYPSQRTVKCVGTKALVPLVCTEIVDGTLCKIKPLKELGDMHKKSTAKSYVKKTDNRYDVMKGE